MGINVQIVSHTLPAAATPLYPLPPASVTIQFLELPLTIGNKAFVRVRDYATGGFPYLSTRTPFLLLGETVTIQLPSATNYKMPATKDLLLALEVGWVGDLYDNYIVTDTETVAVVRGDTHYTCPAPNMYYDPIRGGCFPIDVQTGTGDNTVYLVVGGMLLLLLVGNLKGPKKP